MSDFREEEALGKAYDSQLLRRLMTYLRPYKWTVVIAIVLTLLVGPLEVGLSPAGRRTGHDLESVAPP